MTRFLGAAITALLLSTAQAGYAESPGSVSPTVTDTPLIVFLVRHGEKMHTGKDPDLSDAGRKRARKLAKTLRSAEIDYIHSSDYVRTRQTAAPTAAARGLQVQLYKPGDLAALVENLREKGGRHLVVGHSNTTPEMVELLTGMPVAEIDESAEYDRLYVVMVGSDGTASSVLMRYGRRYKPGPAP